MNTCETCNHYRMTHDGPYCYKDKIHPTSPLLQKDCWEAVTEKPEIATKVCKRCGQELPVSAFGRHSKTRDGYQPVCRLCLSKQKKGKPRAAKMKKAEGDDVTNVTPPSLDQFTDDQLIEEIRRRGWGGRLSITHNYML